MDGEPQVLKLLNLRQIHISALLIALALPHINMPLAEAQDTPAASIQNTPVQIHALKVTLLSTMLVGSTTGLGEWGFSALIEADGHRVLLDTGAHPDTVLRNARDLRIDLSDVREVILTHNHWDHVSGLMTLRKEMMKKNPSALSVKCMSHAVFSTADLRPRVKIIA
jgi:predicted metal-dependent RNase